MDNYFELVPDDVMFEILILLHNPIDYESLKTIDKVSKLLSDDSFIKRIIHHIEPRLNVYKAKHEYNYLNLLYSLLTYYINLEYDAENNQISMYRLNSEQKNYPEHFLINCFTDIDLSDYDEILDIFRENKYLIEYLIKESFINYSGPGNWEELILPVVLNWVDITKFLLNHVYIKKDFFPKEGELILIMCCGRLEDGYDALLLLFDNQYINLRNRQALINIIEYGFCDLLKIWVNHPRF